MDLTPQQCKLLAGLSDAGTHIMLLPRIEDGYARVLIYGPEAKAILREADETIRTKLMVPAGPQQQRLDFR
jgi:hypothetical protein